MAYAKQDIKSAVATIEKIVIKNNRVSILTNGDIWYSFFQTDQSGKMTSPQSSFQTQNVSEGMSFIITYTEKTFTDGRIFKNAISFTPSNGASPSQVPQAAQPRVVQQAAPVDNRNYEEKREEEVIGKVASMFMAAFITGVAQAGGTLAQCQGHVDQAVMLAERLCAASKGPRRQKLHKQAMAEAHVPQQASEADLAGPWDEHIASNMSEPEDDSEPWAV